MAKKRREYSAVERKELWERSVATPVICSPGSGGGPLKSATPAATL